MFIMSRTFRFLRLNEECTTVLRVILCNVNTILKGFRINFMDARFINVTSSNSVNYQIFLRGLYRFTRKDLYLITRYYKIRTRGGAYHGKCFSDQRTINVHCLLRLNTFGLNDFNDLLIRLISSNGTNAHACYDACHDSGNYPLTFACRSTSGNAYYYAKTATSCSAFNLIIRYTTATRRRYTTRGWCYGFRLLRGSFSLGISFVFGITGLYVWWPCSSFWDSPILSFFERFSF